MSFFHKKAIPLIDLSVLKTDIHSHLLPGIDDGCQNIDESVELIEKLKDLKYEKLITTPHINYNYPKNTAELILEKLKELKEKLVEKNISITIEAAAEYMIDDGFEEKFHSGNLLTFGKKYILIELPFFFPPVNLNHFLFQLQIEGYKIILAHPERYSYWHHSFDKYEELKDRGIYFQLNMVSLTGIYSHHIRRTAEKMIDNNMIDFVGTDIHHLSYFDSIKNSMSEPYLSKLISYPHLLNNTI